MPIDLASLKVDLMSFSAHKTYGPKGIGALFVRRKPRVRIEAQMHGGGHERGMRSGTLPTHQIVGLGSAYRLARESMHVDIPRIAGLREQLWRALADIPGVELNGDPLRRVAGILNVSGNFSQTGPGTTFIGSGAHTVFLDGAGAQTLDFAAPGFGAGRFQNVIIANSAGGVTATSDLMNGSVWSKSHSRSAPRRASPWRR